MRRHILQHHGARTHFRSFANVYVAKDFGASADQDTISDLRVPISVLLASPAERDRLQNRDAVADDGGLTDHQAGSVIKHDAVSKTGCGVNVDAEVT